MSRVKFLADLINRMLCTSETAGKKRKNRNSFISYMLLASCSCRSLIPVLCPTGPPFFWVILTRISTKDWPLWLAPFFSPPSLTKKVKSSSRWPFDYLWVVIFLLKSRRRASFCNQCNRMTRLNFHPTNQQIEKGKKHLMRTCSCACVKQIRGALLGGRPSPVTRRETAPARNCSGKHPWGENRKSEQYLPGALSLLLEEV